MEPLKPIPVPFKRRWHEFRVVYLPLLNFVFLIALISWMWNHYVQPGTIVGEVEAIRANIISVVPGTITSIQVDRLETVTNGQVLAVVSVMDPSQLEAELKAAEADLRVTKTRMDLDHTRNLESYSRLRLDLQIEQFNLEAARIRLTQAEAELARTRQLYAEELVSRGGGSGNNPGLDVALRDRDELNAEVVSREKTVAELEAGVKRMEASGVGQFDPTDASVEQAISAERERVKRLKQPIVLRSPIDGFISAINNLPGEKVTAGTPILTVSAGTSDRILAWVRQPVTVRPNVGDTVEVRRVVLGQVGFEGTIMEVGKQLEPISPTVLSVNANMDRMELGLPLIIKSAAAQNLYPGERVQLRITHSVASSSVN